MYFFYFPFFILCHVNCCTSVCAIINKDLYYYYNYYYYSSPFQRFMGSTFRPLVFFRKHLNYFVKKYFKKIAFY